MNISESKKAYNTALQPKSALDCLKIRMENGTQKSTQLTLARASLALSSLVFAIGAAIAFTSAASALVVLILAACAALFLWVGIFGSDKVALFFGRFFPLG
jgi:hypothetical protein